MHYIVHLAPLMINVNECLTVIMYIGFAEYPSNFILLLESEMEAVFECRHQSTEAIIGWRVNGSSLGEFPNIREANSIRENNARVYTLTIPARSKYNGMEVVCVAAFTDASPTEVTPSVFFSIMEGN